MQNAYITPGYPLFLSVIYLVAGYKSGSPIMAVRVIQAIIGSLTCIVVYLLGKKLKNKRVGFIAALSYAVYPPFVRAVALILTETLFNLLFLVYMYLQVVIFAKKSKALSFLCGLSFGISVMVRPVIFPLFIVPYILKCFVNKNRYAIFKKFIYGIAGIFIIMTPWWTRNALVLHKFILLATQTGNPLIAGTFPYYQNMDLSKYEVNDQFTAGIKYILDGFATQPLLYLKWFTIGKFNYIFGSPWIWPVKDFTFLTSLDLFHYAVVVLGWLGVVFSFVKKKMRLISMFVVMMTLLQLLFVPENRYAHAIIPFLMLLTGYVLDYMFFESREKLSGFKQPVSS